MDYYFGSFLWDLSLSEKVYGIENKEPKRLVVYTYHR